MRSLLLLGITFSVAAGFTPIRAEAIDAVRGKSYQLTKRHGPWMVMVASFRDVSEADRKIDGGLSAEEAAAELVYELREKGIPAYTFRQSSQIETVKTRDRQGRDDTRQYTAQRDMVCVLAGNYPSIEDEIAQKTLNWVKRYHPNFMKDTKSGAIYRQTPGRQGPLSGAFLSINPMLSGEELPKLQSDRLTQELNSGIDNALVENRHRYTVKVATFTGRSTLPGQKMETMGTGFGFNFRNNGAAGEEYNLNTAGEDAAQLARALRQQKIEAYVYHDHYQSVVTVGGFDSADDPRILQALEKFGAKSVLDPSNRQAVTVAETFALPGKRPSDPPTRTWIFDPRPQVMEVPRIR